VIQIPVVLSILCCQGRTARQLPRAGGVSSSTRPAENLQGSGRWCRCSAGPSTHAPALSVTTDAYRKAVGGTIFTTAPFRLFLKGVLTGVAWCWLSWLMVTTGAMGFGHPPPSSCFSQRAVGSLRQLGGTFTQIQGGLTAVERIGELLEEPLEISDWPSPQRTLLPSIPPERSSAGEVIFDNVSFAYRPDVDPERPEFAQTRLVSMWP